MNAALKIYISFDADRDIKYYRIIESWNGRHGLDFINVHYSSRVDPSGPEAEIKKRLSKRLRSSDLFVLLIGERTRFLYKYVRWEINQAIQLKHPIICMNLNGCMGLDTLRCPPLLRNINASHIPFGKNEFRSICDMFQEAIRKNVHIQPLSL